MQGEYLTVSHVWGEAGDSVLSKANMGVVENLPMSEIHQDLIVLWYDGMLRCIDTTTHGCTCRFR